MTSSKLISVRARRAAGSINRLAKGHGCCAKTSTQRGIVETLLDVRAFCRMTGYDFDEALEHAKSAEALENAMRREGLIQS